MIKEEEMNEEEDEDEVGGTNNSPYNRKATLDVQRRGGN
jgi:hypothetical protein